MALLYRPLENAKALGDWARGQGFTDIVPANWHVSIAKADTGAGLSDHALHTSPLIVPASAQRLVGRMGGIIALMFRSPIIERRHRALRIAGADWDHRDFRCHITIVVDDGRDLAGIAPYDGELVLGGEVWSMPRAGI
jgi:hypothetical protein